MSLSFYVKENLEQLLMNNSLLGVVFSPLL